MQQLIIDILCLILGCASFGVPKNINYLGLGPPIPLPREADHGFLFKPFRLILDRPR